MKVSNNALNFLLAQYRAIFKRAYVKGLASAVMLTAALAAGQAQADITDTSHASLSGAEEVTVDGASTKITISGTTGGTTIDDWSAPVKITGGLATTDNYIKGSGGAVDLTGKGSLKIEVADDFTTKGLAINADAQGATVLIDSIAVNKGTLAIASAASKTATVSAQSITIGEDPASGSTPTVRAAGDPAGILSLTASGDGGSVTLGTAGETSIKVKSTGQLKVIVDSGTATINGTSLALNDKAFMLVANGANKGNTLTVASDTFTIAQDAVHVISSEAAGKAVTEKFTGKTATISGNVLITANSKLDLSTTLGTGAAGEVENQGTVTLADGSNTVLGGTLKVSSGTLVVEKGAQLNASVEKATIEIAETSASKSTLEISSSTLKDFLAGGNSYQAIDINGTTATASDPSKEGALTISSGTLRFTDDNVTLSDFAFKGAADSTATAGSITFNSGSVTNIVGENFTIKKQLDSSTTGANSKIMLKADSLSLGGDAALDDYGFSGATVANLRNTNTAGAISLGNAVTLDVTVGDPAANIPVDANGVFSGDFVLDDSTNGKLTVAHGTYTHNDSLTIKGTGKLDVTNTADSRVNTKLTLTNLDLQAGAGTAITVDGKDNDAASTILDISSAKFTVSGGTASGTITVQSGGTLVATGTQVQDILSAKGTSSAGLGVALNHGTLEVTDALKLDASNNLTTNASAQENKIAFNNTSGGNIKVNGELTLTSADTLNFDKSTFSAAKLTLETASAASKLQAGTYTVWSGLNSKNGVEVSGATLLLGGFDENGDAISNNGTLKTDLTLKDGNVTVQNGSWTGSSQTLTVAGGTFTVGDAQKVDASGNTFATSLGLNKIAQTGGTATIDTVGSVTTNSLEVASGATKLQVDGSLTVNGDYTAAVGSTPASYGVALTANKITLGENANLTFGADATKAIKVRDDEDATKGWISAVDGTFGKADTAQTVIDSAVGSTVTFEFAEGISFNSAALAEFRKEIFGVAEGGNLDGFVNLGAATIEGLTVENGEVAWSDLQGLIDVGDLADFTTQDLLTAKVTGITSDAELRGSLGSLSSAEHTAGGQIAVDGNLTLNNAAGNEGAFASNTAGDVLGLNVTENARVTLNNGGEIGKVTFSSKGGSFVVTAENGTTKIAEIDGAHASTQFNAGTTTVTGETETAQLTTAAGTNTTFGGDVIVGQSVAENAISNLEGDTTFNGAATFAKDVAVKEAITK